MSHPKDSLARFTWASLAHYYYLLQPNPLHASERLIDVSRNLAAHSTPHSYQYARLRFLIACIPGGSSVFPFGTGPYLKELGERLIKRSPNDLYIKSLQIDNLRTGIPEDERKAIRYINDWIAANPDEAWGYSTLGFFYQRWTWLEKPKLLPDKQAAQLAISAYKKALSLGKLSIVQQRQTKNSIERLQKILVA